MINQKETKLKIVYLTASLSSFSCFCLLAPMPYSSKQNYHLYWNSFLLSIYSQFFFRYFCLLFSINTLLENALWSSLSCTACTGHWMLLFLLFCIFQAHHTHIRYISYIKSILRHELHLMISCKDRWYTVAIFFLLVVWFSLMINLNELRHDFNGNIKLWHYLLLSIMTPIVATTVYSNESVFTAEIYVV